MLPFARRYGVSARSYLAPMRSRVDRHLGLARRRLSRISAEQAAAELAEGALLIDTRTETQRAQQGTIAGAIAVDRTVLEWRLDPTSPSRIPEAIGPDTRVILICAEGYSSSLAAASLKAVGLQNVTDVIGGFEAWRATGLPIESGPNVL